MDYSDMNNLIKIVNNKLWKLLEHVWYTDV